MRVIKGTILFLMIGTLIWSCSSNDDNSDLPDEGGTDAEETHSLAGEWIMDALSFEGSTEQEDGEEVRFKGNDKELDSDDVFYLNDDGTYQAGTESMALNVTVKMGDQTLEGEDLTPLGTDSDHISPFLTAGTWEANDDNTEITFVEDQSKEATTFKVDEYDGESLKITSKGGYSLVQTAGIIPTDLAEALEPIDIELTMEFERN